MNIRLWAAIHRVCAAFLVAATLVACSTTPSPAPQPPRPAPAPPAPPSLPQKFWTFIDPCRRASPFAAAAVYNADAETGLVFSPFGKPETGWALYVPQIQATLQTRCRPGTDGFAEAVARWQTDHGLVPSGALTADTFQTLKGVWQERRPFVMMRFAGLCPTGADETTLVALTPDETLGDKVVMLRPGASQALRSMVAAARADVPEMEVDPDLLKAFSAYRSPVADAARCKYEKNCQGMVRAECSAHRTGLAVDLDVGYAPGFMADGSADENRLFQSRTPVYRWLVRNAARFGFVNYVFEPWHWEWTGEPLTPGAVSAPPSRRR
jgi:hypothetical protein